MRVANARGVKRTPTTGASTAAGHPQYTERNRVQQRTRNARRAVIANEDVSRGDCPIVSGTYQLIPGGEEVIAKSDAWTVEITLLSRVVGAP